MVVRIVVLEIPSHVPDQGIVRSQVSTERSWFKVPRFCYMLMKYSCDRRRLVEGEIGILLVLYDIVILTINFKTST